MIKYLLCECIDYHKGEPHKFFLAAKKFMHEPNHAKIGSRQFCANMQVHWCKLQPLGVSQRKFKRIKGYINDVAVPDFAGFSWPLYV